MERSRVIRDAAAVPENAVVSGFFLEAQVLVSVAFRDPAAIAVDERIAVQLCPDEQPLEVLALDATPPRSRIEARVVHRGVRREFVGFNRARHAVLEAAILATRVRLLPAAQIREELERLQVLVDKTAGPREREAWALVGAYVASQLGTGAPT